MTRIYLSPPHMSGKELGRVHDVFHSNWIAPLGPEVDAFEADFCAAIGCTHALALSSGTAALHLALIDAGVSHGDEVLVSTLTFSASVNPIVYCGGAPVFIDSETASWNMDPDLVADTIASRVRKGRRPKAVVLVHLYGQCADIDPILATCAEFEIPLIEDAAEALGARYKGRSPGTFGRTGIFSFNGNKIITTSGGGMLVSDDEAVVEHSRKLSTQARDAAAHYEHSEIGYNYRLSNILAGVGRAQLRVLEDRVAARRANFSVYARELGAIPGVSLMPEAEWGRHNRWLTVITIDPSITGVDREAVRLACEAEDIEARPVWKPMHMQPIFSRYEVVGGSVAERLFADGLCLPSGSNLTDADRARVVGVVKRALSA